MGGLPVVGLAVEGPAVLQHFGTPYGGDGQKGTSMLKIENENFT